MAAKARRHRQDRERVACAQWCCLLANLWLLILDQRLVTPLEHLALLTPRYGLHLEQCLSLACVAFVIFRLVRPQPTASDAQDATPHWFADIARLLLLVATVTSAATLAWAALGPGLARERATLGLALPLISLSGLLAIEAANLRRLAPAALAHLHVSMGLLSATLMLPSILYWYMSAQRASGLARALADAALGEGGQLRLAVYLCLATCIAWWLGTPLRRRLWRVPVLRAALHASWTWVCGALLAAQIGWHARPWPPASSDDWWHRLGTALQEAGGIFPWTAAVWLLIWLALYLRARRPAEQHT